MVHKTIDMIHLAKDTAVVVTMFATGVVIDAATLIPIGSFAAVCGLIWWIARKTQRWDDRLEAIEKSIEGLECVRHKICPKKESSEFRPYD